MTEKISGFEERQSVVVRFAGDSGDGMQTVGERFTDSSVVVPNAIATFPDFPAEIRAPAGTIPGVSAFQVHFGSREILTPGDEPDALIAMNPAALKVHLDDLTQGGMLVVNTGAFTPENLKMAGYESNPLEDPELAKKYELVPIDITELTKEALKDSALKTRDKLRCKNFFALGFTYWVYGRPLDPTTRFVQDKWGKKLPEVAEANVQVLKAGYFFGETSEIHRNRYMVTKAVVRAGRYRKISGNEALVLGLVAGARQAEKELVYSGYPITPASSILEMVSTYKHFGIKSVQAEDEIAAIGVALGASFAGSIGITGTSGPGMCLKSEFMGLAASVELPLVICNIQRGGPSTGLPTKTEQSDLLQAMFGRHGESPLPIVAAMSPSDCFPVAYEAMRIAITYSTPVIILSDLYVANGAEPWRLPDLSEFSPIEVPTPNTDGPYRPFERNPETLARAQAIPGTKGFEHRLGGLEKNDAGEVSYDPENHEHMTEMRASKIQRIADSYAPLIINGEPEGDVLALAWGGTFGAVTSAVRTLQAEGYKVSSVHLRHLNPLPNDLEATLRQFKKVIIPELNTGQLAMLVRARYLIDAVPLNKMKGRPFKVAEIRDAILNLIPS
ncbi:2-oxoacid:acceptor oxidoreductase subunit alpha [Puniceicoccales bacterium CK1056]|uniref:2-oxoacid:acceptor oxidoreductase subunit alpha n=1 Tax=Oceanipulchritudo coccoides TaxID=2706888 RepID=A0A6B2M5C8_9BACT|nr:2-oxoacid:acceptor oxidoreductase subunit alpha [Oceanipulchritudo coccoides]NDV63432.1 2-oxoacid:acceptor oxidoreductase subunit alpha [Oceanipulchritudo coccoides]